MLTVGNKIPEFSLTGVVSNDIDTAFQTITHNTNAGKWKVFFFYPKDFTFVCPTEIAEFDRLNSEFAKRNTQVYGVSTDSDFVHLAWRRDHPSLHELSFPLISDITRKFSNDMGVLSDEAGVCLRATYIVDSDNIIRSVVVNDLQVGRNPSETLRTLDALQSGELCGCNWKAGDKHLAAV